MLENYNLLLSNRYVRHLQSFPFCIDADQILPHRIGGSSRPMPFCILDAIGDLGGRRRICLPHGCAFHPSVFSQDTRCIGSLCARMVLFQILAHTYVSQLFSVMSNPALLRTPRNAFGSIGNVWFARQPRRAGS